MELRISEQGLEHLEKWEGLRTKAYKDTAGIWTIGIGSTRYFDQYGQPPVKPGDEISEAYARDLAETTVDMFLAKIEPMIKVDLEWYQVDAIASFVYNIGVGAFSTSTFLKRLNAGDFEGAADAMMSWNKDRDPRTKQLRVNKGLNNRRTSERLYFLGFTH